MGCGISSSSSPSTAEQKRENKLTMDEIDSLIPDEANNEGRESRKRLFEKFDKNGSKKLTYEEVLAGCKDVLHLDRYTNRLPDVVRRSFDNAKAALTEKSTSGDANQVEYMEFNILMRQLRYHMELMVVFDSIDTSDNGLIDQKEFDKGAKLLEQYGVTLDDTKATFKMLDSDGTGNISAGEFLDWAVLMRLKANPVS
ncbi:flagellar calcium-binding protein [Angomonas deanei]|uniref:EF-hand domain pair/EF hand, putative n=1 Tax=Angomonas deanei TaxID=59799 RepID=A0A7G2BZ08_9TRYP|nr:flagellar calcium-binding protein [Angomonas deanei]CAD2212738.1 EF-hand domain pair/EF hand, putative [Angomonas deanei]|eukprot:EPY21348.1 flagellar calcium-binding protein [Angomonas deanei]